MNPIEGKETQKTGNAEAEDAAMKDLGSVIWRFFCSLKLTLILLVLIALGSVVGTLIQQNLSAHDYLRLYGPGTTRLLLRFGLTDLYHSWWFGGLLFLLSVNLLTCSLERFPGVWALIRKPRQELDEASLRALPFTHAMSANESEDLLVTQAEGAIREVLHRHATRTQGTDGITLYATKGAYSRLGVFLVHASILIIFAGALIGSIWGYKAFVNISEGGSASEIVLRNTETPIRLPFTLQLDSFHADFYPTGQPKDFVSRVRVLEGGRVLKAQEIRVNHPLSYGGLHFYQSSYGTSTEATLNIDNRKTQERRTVTLDQGEEKTLPDGMVIALLDAIEDHQGRGPALHVGFKAADAEPREAMLFQRFPMFDQMGGDDWILSIGELKSKPYTGLQVNRDPGVWVVWLGCVLMVAGMMGAFFLYHRELWIMVRRKDGVTELLVGGKANRNRLAFEKEFTSLLEHLNTRRNA